MVFYWNFSENESPQVSRNLLSILADLKNAVVLIVPTSPLISKSSCPCINPLVTVPRAPNTICITVTFMFHGFLIPWQDPCTFLLFTLFQFYSVVCRDSKVFNFASSLFLLIIIRSASLADISWSVGISKSHRHYYNCYYSLAFPQIIWTLPSILVNFNNVVVRMVLIFHLIWIFCTFYSQGRLIVCAYTLGNMFKFEYPPQFLVHHLHRSVIPSLAFHLFPLPAFAYLIYWFI